MKWVLFKEGTDPLSVYYDLVDYEKCICSYDEYGIADCDFGECRARHSDILTPELRKERNQMYNIDKANDPDWFRHGYADYVDFGIVADADKVNGQYVHYFMFFGMS